MTDNRDTISNICVFCSACDGIRPSYFEAARRLGRWIGSTGKTLIYGGVDLGLMGCIAEAAKSSGGRLIGIVPGKFEEDGKASTLCDEIINVPDLSARKDRMVRLADAVIALPGGVGTMDEVFTVMAATSVGYHRKRVLLYDIDGFYDPLIRLMTTLSDEHFLRHGLDKYMLVAHDIDEIITSLQDYDR